MSYVDFGQASMLMDLYVIEAQRQAQARKWHHQAGAGQRLRPSRLGGGLVGRMGHQLVLLGQYLVKYNLPQPSQ